MKRTCLFRRARIYLLSLISIIGLCVGFGLWGSPAIAEDYSFQTNPCPGGILPAQDDPLTLDTEGRIFCIKNPNPFDPSVFPAIDRNRRVFDSEHGCVRKVGSLIDELYAHPMDFYNLEIVIPAGENGRIPISHYHKGYATATVVAGKCVHRDSTVLNGRIVFQDVTYGDGQPYQTWFEPPYVVHDSWNPSNTEECRLVGIVVVKQGEDFFTPFPYPDTKLSTMLQNCAN
jgi:hypothetical protein